MPLKWFRDYVTSNPTTLDLLPWLPASITADLRKLFSLTDFALRPWQGQDDLVQEQRGTGMLLRAIRRRNQGQRRRPRTPTEPQIVHEHLLEQGQLPSTLQAKRTLAALIQVHDRPYARALSSTVEQRAPVRPLIITGTEVTKGWSVSARFWETGDTTQCVLSIGNLPAPVYEGILARLRWAPGYGHLTLTNPRLVFASIESDYRGWPVAFGLNFSAELQVGANLQAILGTAPLLLQGPLSPPPGDAPVVTEDVLDLQTYPRRIITIPPLTFHFVRIRTQLLFDRELEISWPQLAIQGELLMPEIWELINRVPMWSPLPADDGVLNFSMMDGHRFMLTKLSPVYALFGNTWVPAAARSYLEGGFLDMTRLSITYDLHARVVSQVGFSILCARKWSLQEGVNRNLVLYDVLIETTILFPNDGGRRRILVAAKGWLRVDGRWSFPVTLDFTAQPWVTGVFQAPVNLGDLRHATFLGMAVVPATADDTVYTSIVFRLFNDRIELDATSPAGEGPPVHVSAAIP